MSDPDKVWSELAQIRAELKELNTTLYGLLGAFDSYAEAVTQGTRAPEPAEPDATDTEVSEAVEQVEPEAEPEHQGKSESGFDPALQRNAIRQAAIDAGVPADDISVVNIRDERYYAVDGESPEFRTWSQQADYVEVAEWGTYEKEDGTTGYYPEKLIVPYFSLSEGTL